MPQLIITDLGNSELALAVVQGGVTCPPSCVLTSRIVLGSPAWAGVCPDPSACVCTLQGIFVHSAVPPAPLEGGLAPATPQVGNRAGGRVPPCCKSSFPPPPCVCPPRTGPSGDSAAPPPVATSRVVTSLPHLPCPCELIWAVCPTGGAFSQDNAASWPATLGW